jgi:uncharacterized protein (DUF433 family)
LEALPVAEDIRTDHPHIVMTEGYCGGRPRIKGTRISVEFIARFLKSGTDPLEIAATYPHLTLAAVYDAASYYFDHKAEVDRSIEENTLEKVLERHNLVLEASGRVVPRAS